MLESWRTLIVGKFITLSSQGLQWLRRWTADKWSLGKPYTFNFLPTVGKICYAKNMFWKGRTGFVLSFRSLEFPILQDGRNVGTQCSVPKNLQACPRSLAWRSSIKPLSMQLTNWTDSFEPTFPLEILGAVVFTRREKTHCSAVPVVTCGRDTVPQGSESGRCLRSASDRAWAIPRIGCSLWPPRRAVGRRLGKMIAWVAWIACVQWVGLTGLWIVVTSR